jgi:type II secretion system protein G
MTRNRKAFTLIELLIVVAIIAILAAIAVPNFLEAQVRAKVAKVYTDFRATQTALESYAVDNRDYPPSGNFIEPPQARFVPLTTPIAYISKLPGPSPFTVPDQFDGSPWMKYYQYSRGRDMIAGDNEDYTNGWYVWCNGQALTQEILDGPDLEDGPAWCILDRGPDQLYWYMYMNDWMVIYLGASAGPNQQRIEAIVFYDPTNGTVSEGELCASQKKGSNKS